MFSVVRMFASGSTAQSAADELRGEKRYDVFSGRDNASYSVNVLSPAGAASAASDEDGADADAGSASSGGPSNADAVAAAVADGVIPGELADACTAGLDAGNHIVAVGCAFGTTKAAEAALDAHGPVAMDAPEPSSPRLSVSDFLGIPELLDSPTPMSDMLALETLKPSGTIFGGGTSSFSLSGMLGLPLLTKSGPILGGTASSYTVMGGSLTSGGPVLGGKTIDNPTPLSSAIGMRTLTKESGGD